MTDSTAPTTANNRWRPSWRTLALWLALWLPWLYVGVFAYTARSLSFWDGSFKPQHDFREFGWPYPYLELSWDLQPTASDPSAMAEFFYPSLLAVNLLLSVAIAAALAFIACKWVGIIRRNGFRYRIATLLLLVLVISLPLALYRYVEEEYQREAAIKVALIDLGVNVRSSDSPLLAHRLEWILPDHAREMWQRPKIAIFVYFGDEERLHKIVELLRQLKKLDTIGLSGEADPVLSLIHTLPSMRILHLSLADVSETGIEHLMKCPWLEEIGFDQTTISTDALQRLQAALPDTEILHDEEPSP